MSWGVWLTVAGLVGMLAGEKLGAKGFVAIAKPAASTGFLWAAFDAGAFESLYGQLIGVGLVLSWVGDVALLSRSSRWFLIGLISFAAAHLAYAVAFAKLGISTTTVLACGAGLAMPAWLIYRWLRPHLPDDMVRPVQVYVLLISMMVACAGAAVLAGETRLIAIGAVMFYLSDISVARDRFVDTSFTNRLWGWPLYYAAQLVLAVSIAETSPAFLVS